MTQQQVDPTPAEIAQRAAEIRQGWSQDEHIKRGSMSLGTAKMTAKESHAIIDAARAALAAGDEVQRV
jgi:hypothetical protein